MLDFEDWVHKYWDKLLTMWRNEGMDYKLDSDWYTFCEEKYDEFYGI